VAKNSIRQLDLARSISRTYFARIRIKGKLIVKSLKTDSIAVAKLRLADLEKDERQAAEHRDVRGHGENDVWRLSGSVSATASG